MSARFAPLCLLAAAPLAAMLGAELPHQLDRLMEKRHAVGDFTGSVLIARAGKVVYEHGFGLANLEWNIPNDPQTKFEIGSMTKQFTALLILQFVNEGRVRLDGHLSQYLTYYRNDTGSRVTVHHLLTHTSGIPNFIEAPGFLEGTESRRPYTVGEFAQQHC
ncbi:MAG: beta-lactamase family protein, partial [Acidobacteriota bacterium]|nr:beta-lactamase family protein [Acidobacteriota bacterium]